MSNKNSDTSGNRNDWVWWLIAIFCFCTGGLWWVGVILIILNAKGKLPPLRKSASEAFHQAIGIENVEMPTAEQAKAQPVPARGKKKKRTGLLATIIGAITGGIGAIVLIDTFWEIVELALWGIWDVSWLPSYLEDGFTGLVFLAIGAVIGGFGIKRMHREKMFQRYSAMVAGRDGVSVHAMADALGVPYQRACKQLQEMIDDGWFGSTAVLDLNRGRLMLSGLELEQEQPEPQPEATPEETISEEEKILRQIRADNDLIGNPEISRKIDRIEELTRKIFAYIREKPEKAGELRSFLNYYLPQTLKILETYARLEAQGVEGDNITAAKQRIEGMMDTLVESYERQLDKLFEGDVLDITSDIEVMEAMLARDGLKADELLK
jgi:hypothetical protein